MKSFHRGKSAAANRTMSGARTLTAEHHTPLDTRRPAGVGNGGVNI